MSDTAAAAVESYWPASTGRDDLQKNSQVRKNRRERERERMQKRDNARARVREGVFALVGECEREERRRNVKKE